jgi:hypothetical protein
MRYNRWEVASFVSFGCAAVYLIIALILHHRSTLEIRPEFMLLPATGFVAFGTTGAMKRGAFHIEFSECSRLRTPISFWFSVIFGYLFSAALLTLFFATIYFPQAESGPRE